MDVMGSVLGAMFFIAVMGRVPHPMRREYNAVLVAGASAAYLSGGGFGVWELPYVAIAGGVVSYLGLRSYRWIGVAWLMHTVWDLAHHSFGNPLWPFLETSSMGCAIFDAVIAIWFLMGAPTWAKTQSSDGAAPEGMVARGG